MTHTIHELECAWCGARLRHHGPLPHPFDPCPRCQRDTLFVVSSRPMHDPVQVPDRRTT